MKALLAISGLLVALGAAPAFGERLPRVISLDSCSDQLVLALAEDRQIIALSQDSRGAFSYYAARAEKFPQHFGTAEEILLLGPDLVLSTGAGDPALVLMLERLGIRVVKTGLPKTIEDALDDLGEVGAALGVPEKAAALSQKTEAELQALRAKPALGQSALYVSPSGVTTGSGTFLHQTIELAGLKNLMAEAGGQGWSSFKVEAFIKFKPDILITSFFNARIGNAESWRFAAHPAMQAAMADVSVVDIPSRYLSCPAWYAVEGAALIRSKVEEGTFETTP